MMNMKSFFEIFENYFPEMIKQRFLNLFSVVDFELIISMTNKSWKFIGQEIVYFSIKIDSKLTSCLLYFI